MRPTILVIALVIALAGCSSPGSSAGPKPTSTPKSSQVITEVVPTLTPNPKASPVPTLKPGATPPKLPTLKIATPKTATPYPAAAYRSIVYGKVTDVKTHKPIAGATISVAEGQRSTHTDAHGRYRIRFPSKQPVSLQVTKKGYVCGLGVGFLTVKQTLRKDWTCQRSTPSHPAVPPAPGIFGHTP